MLCSNCIENFSVRENKIDDDDDDDYDDDD
jgi:hypothetical protein